MDLKGARRVPLQSADHLNRVGARGARPCQNI
jgi:hypothetical protein